MDFWPCETRDLSLDWRILSFESKAILVGPTDNSRPISRFDLPCEIARREVAVVSRGDHFEVKLDTLATCSSPQQRPDLVIEAPLSTAELRTLLPDAFVCSTCNAIVIDSSTIGQYNALPSEHWAELLDAWMCHQDQTLSDDLVAKGRGIKPRPDEGLVANTYLLFQSHLLRNWTVQQETQEVSVSGLPRALLCTTLLSNGSSKKVCLSFHPVIEHCTAGTSRGPACAALSLEDSFGWQTDTRIQD